MECLLAIEGIRSLCVRAGTRSPCAHGAGVEDGGLQVSSAGSARLKKRKKMPNGCFQLNESDKN